MKRFLLFILLIMATSTFSQSLLPLNSSYSDGYLIGLYNPAPFALIGNLQVAAGIQFLHAGLAEDDLRNHYLYAVLPVSSKTAFGLRTQYFTADIFQNLELSLLASRALYKDKLAFGLNLNMLHHSFNKENFVLFDKYDPVIADGNSSTAFSFGGSLYLQPIRGLNIGLAADHLNEPDVSLDKSGIRQKRIYHAGLSYTALPILPLVPQIDLRMEGDELITQIGAHLTLLDKHLNLFAGYSSFDGGGSNALAEAELRYKNIGFVYAFQYPLTADISSLSNGTHQIGMVLHGGEGRPPTMPVVRLDNLSSRLQIPQAWLRGKASNEDGLKLIEIRNNDKLWKAITSEELKNAKTFNIDKTIPLEIGRNIVQITAFGNGISGSDKVFTLFEPEAPKIEMLSGRNTQVKDDNYLLHFTVTDANEVKRVRIYCGTELLEDITKFPSAKAADITRPTRLMEGRNLFHVIAENPWMTSQDSIWIEYRPKETPPSLTIVSKDQPISASSQIVINLNLENAEYIKEVIIKVNGAIVDTARIKRTRLFTERQVVGYDSLVVVNLTSQSKNLIEAIAVDDQGLPRISQSLNVYHNPYAQEMRYSKKRAFIIGINNYKNNNVPDLIEAIPDARKMAGVLDSTCHFDRIDMFLDEQASFESLYALFSDSLLRAKPGELIVIYFSGHGDRLGASADDALGFLLPWDAALESHSKHITMDYISGYIRKSPAADVLCIFDACFSGTCIVSRPNLTYELLPNKVAYDSLRLETGKKALNMITAGTRSEQAVDGLFTRILVRGLKGAADRNDDGYITSAELAMYVQKFTSDEAQNIYLRKQNPQYGGLTSERGECVFERK